MSYSLSQVVERQDQIQQQINKYLGIEGAANVWAKGIVGASQSQSLESLKLNKTLEKVVNQLMPKKISYEQRRLKPSPVKNRHNAHRTVQSFRNI